MRLAAALVIFAPVPAFAHGGPAGHAHPHGLEGALLAFILIAAAWLAWRLAK